jgi:oxygen-independent coproporphyrinogen-3 oxidase
MCQCRINIAEVESTYGITFTDYFAEELAELTAADSPSTDGLVTVGPTEIEVTSLGRLFVRNVCMVFDRYLRGRLAGPKPVFSRTV